MGHLSVCNNYHYDYLFLYFSFPAIELLIQDCFCSAFVFTGQAAALRDQSCLGEGGTDVRQNNNCACY